MKGRLRQFQMVLAVADLGNTHRAARKLAVSQPAVTKAIQDFEDVLGMAVFERHARGMRPTPAGRELLPLLRGMIEAAGRCAEAVAVRQSTESTIVRIGAVAAGLSGTLAHHLPGFSAKYPHIHLKVHEIDGRRLQSLVGAGECDIFVCRIPETIPEAWSFTPLVHDEHAILAAPDHPLVGLAGLTRTDLSDCTWLSPPEGVPALHLFQNFTANIPAERFCQIATRSPVVVREALRQRHVLAIAPVSIFQSDLAAGTLQRLDFDLDSALDPIGLLVRSEGSGEACRRLTRYLEEQVAGPAW